MQTQTEQTAYVYQVDSNIPKEHAHHAVEHTRSMFGTTCNVCIVSADSVYAVVRVWPKDQSSAYQREETRCAGWFLHGWYVGNIYSVD